TPYPCFQLEALFLAEDDSYRRWPSHGSLRIISIQRSNHATAQMPRNFRDGTLVSLTRPQPARPDDRPSAGAKYAPAVGSGAASRGRYGLAPAKAPSSFGRFVSPAH